MLQRLGVSLAFLAFVSIEFSYASDPGILSLLKEAQRANIAQYPAGELSAIYREGIVGPEHNIHVYYKCRTIWSSERSWVLVEQWDIGNRSEVPRSQSVQRKEWIRADGRITLHSLSNDSVFILSASKFSPPRVTQLAPHARWYGAMGNTGMTWLQMLDPQLITKVDNTKIRYVTRDLGEGIHEVVRTDGFLDTQWVMTFSLPLDGNLLSYESESPSQGVTKSGRFTWARDSKGRLYVDRAFEERTSVYEDETVRSYFEYQTTSFNPDLRPAADRFKLESLRTQTGSVVRDQVSNRVTRIGDRPLEDVIERLDQLSDVLKVRGFAAPRRGN